uniref:Pellino FHA domain-containing protein n=1 Tax=Knipowitschia caucasica TaxID=637954 RepID=A0AAV2KRI4_KNICA
MSALSLTVPLSPHSEPQSGPVGMVLEGSSEALCPPPSLELRPSCNKSQASPPLGCSSQPHDAVFSEDKEPVKYGELIVLGHNGSLSNGDKGRRRSRLALYKRPKANGVKPDVIHNVSTPLVSKVRPPHDDCMTTA